MPSLENECKIHNTVRVSVITKTVTRYDSLPSTALLKLTPSQPKRILQFMRKEILVKKPEIFTALPRVQIQFSCFHASRRREKFFNFASFPSTTKIWNKVKNVVRMKILQSWVQLAKNIWSSKSTFKDNYIVFYAQCFKNNLSWLRNNKLKYACTLFVFDKAKLLQLHFNQLNSWNDKMTKFSKETKFFVYSVFHFNKSTKSHTFSTLFDENI